MAINGTHVPADTGHTADHNLIDAELLVRLSSGTLDGKYAPVASAWTPLTVYKQNQLVTSGGLLYSSNSNHTSGTPTITLANWTAIGGGSMTFYDAVIRWDGVTGSQPLRTSVTSNTSQRVRWVQPSLPPVTTGYSLPGDVWEHNV